VLPPRIGGTLDQRQTLELGPIQTESGSIRIEGALFRVRNYGKSPGIIFSIDSRLEIGKSRDSPPNPEIYDPPNPLKGIIAIAVGHGSTNQAEEHIVPQGGERIELARPQLNWYSDKELTRVKNDADFLWAYGIVRYPDIYTREHETRF
jgi:hypothetical protein